MTTRRVAWGIWALTIALLAVWPFLGAVSGALHAELLFYLVVPLAVIAYATVGALITSRDAENRIGLLLAGIALAFAIALAAGDYTTVALQRPDSLPFARWVAWVGRVTFALWLAPMPLLFLLYPNGRVATPRWRPVLWVLLAALGINLVLFAFSPGPLAAGFFAELGGKIVNPLGLPLSWKTTVENATLLAALIAVVCAGLAIVSLVLRFRRSTGVERQQIRWLGYVGGVLVAVPLLALLIALVRLLLGVDVSDENDPLGNLAFIAFFTVLLFGVPVACAIAILRYGLYELDVVVKRTVVFAVLVILLTGVGSVAGALAAMGAVPSLSDSPPALVMVGALFGLLAYPLYRLAKRIADRLVFGGRSTPYEVLSSFTERIGGTYAADDVLERMAQLLGQATRAKTARVWLRVGRDLQATASWPAGSADARPIPVVDEKLPGFDGEEAFTVTDRGELLGALSVELPPSDPIDRSKEKLIKDLAAQAGLLLRNAGLIADLKDSRRRIVAVQDERARKLERDIHDGAQQQLVALGVKLGLVERAFRRDAAAAEAMVAEAKVEANEALENLRDLARGIYPPLLADQGLAAALRSQARKAAIPVEVEPAGIGRYPEETEAAVYFSCLEALQNVAKYAEASSATVRLAQSNGSLTFEVADDGRGFDPEAAERGSGLQGIADRLAALGGTLTVRSAPGEGTTIAGSLPVEVSS